jgi:osmoprotectant transport system substrate-binding protein
MFRRIAIFVVAVQLAAACAGGASRRPAPVEQGAPVVVASFNFEESQLLAEVYAQALEHAGIPVRRELNLGTREMVLPALRQGLVDFVPEYLGSALASLEPDANLQGATAATEASRLARDLKLWKVEVLQPAAATDQNSLAVTAAASKRYSVHDISGLGPLAPRMSIGGPSECPSRPFCLVGFRDVYGLRFSRFLPFDSESQRVKALEQGVVDVAVMFTTDGELATGAFVLLNDDRRLQPSENVAPLLSTRASARYGGRIERTVNAVSAKLTTAGLVFLNWRVAVAGNDPATEARGWLLRQGLIPRS